MSGKNLLCARKIEKNNSFQAQCVCEFYQHNISALHGKKVSLNEWISVLSSDDLDEQNFLIYKLTTPVAWLKINGLLNADTAWISMLVVEDGFHKQGVGQFAVDFAEKYVKGKGIHTLGIHTTEDNIPAKNLYIKCGYSIMECSGCTTGDGVSRKGYTFVKNISLG